MSWDRYIKHFGEVAEHSILEHQFTYNGFKKLKLISPSCGCHEVKYNPDTGIVQVKMKTGRVVSHLGFRRKDTYLTVHYEDGTSDKLHLEAIIIKDYEQKITDRE